MKRIHPFVSSLVGLLALCLFAILPTHASAYESGGEDNIYCDDYSAYVSNWGDSENNGEITGNAGVNFMRATSGDCDAEVDVTADIHLSGNNYGGGCIRVYLYTSYEEEFDLNMVNETESIAAIAPSTGGWGGTVYVLGTASDYSGYSYFSDSKSQNYY